MSYIPPFIECVAPVPSPWLLRLAQGSETLGGALHPRGKRINRTSAVVVPALSRSELCLIRLHCIATFPSWPSLLFTSDLPVLGEFATSGKKPASPRGQCGGDTGSLPLAILMTTSLSSATTLAL